MAKMVIAPTASRRLSKAVTEKSEAEYHYVDCFCTILKRWIPHFVFLIIVILSFQNLSFVIDLS